MMNLRHFFCSLIVCMSSVVLSSCDHRVLTDPMNVHYVRVYLEEDIKNVNCGFYNESYEHPVFHTPTNIRACLSDVNTGDVVYEGLLRNRGSDERGNYLDGYVGAPAGDYNMIMYQLGSSITQIKCPNSYLDMMAYTHPVSDRILNYLPQTSKGVEREKILEEPEHLLASRCEGVRVKHSMEVDTLKAPNGDYFEASTIAKSYYLQLRIIGVEWVKAAAALLSGMSGSSRICEEDGLVEDDPIHLFFSMNYADKKKRSGEEASTAILYTTFTTFGKIPDLKSELILSFEFTKQDGSTQVERIDITEAFKTPLAMDKQWILLDEEITIVKPDGTGGMNPGVEGWKDEDADLPM